jgi:hypothetical protein
MQSSCPTLCRQGITLMPSRFIIDSLLGSVEHKTSEFDNFRKNSGFKIHGRSQDAQDGCRDGVTGWEI